MDLPIELSEALEELLYDVKPSDLAQARKELTERYGVCASPLLEERHRLAYMAARMPATYAAVEDVLLALQEVAPDFRPASVLDLGAGPGTASWAAAELFPGIEEITLVESEAGFVELGQKLAQSSVCKPLRDARWMNIRLPGTKRLPEADLVMFGYSLGELPGNQRREVLEQAWEACRGFLAVVEPGTPERFELVLEARELLFDMGAKMAGPCPHERICPMTGPEGDWCHFSRRLGRMRRHRQAKEADLGFEDEKYSYVVVGREEVELPRARIVAPTASNKAMARLLLCEQAGELREETIPRRDKAAWKKARKANWGETWE